MSVQETNFVDGTKLPYESLQKVFDDAAKIFYKRIVDNADFKYSVTFRVSTLKTIDEVVIEPGFFCSVSVLNKREAKAFVSECLKYALLDIAPHRIDISVAKLVGLFNQQTRTMIYE